MPTKTSATLLALFLFLFLPFLAWGQDGEETPQPTATASPFDTYTMVFLKRGEERGQENPEALMQLQTQHRAHLRKLREAGKILVAGPFEASEEQDLRGIAIYRGDLSLEEVERLANDDPAVKAGRLRVEVLRWWTPKDAVSFSDEH